MSKMAAAFLSKEQLVKTWVKKLEQLDRSKSIREKFRDFCEMAYCAIAKTTAPTPERADDLEARYMQIVGTYQDKDAVRAYPELLAMVAQGVDSGWDMLGLISSELNALDAGLGQFFTPMEVSLMMAQMLLGDVGSLIEQQGYITVSEPAAGAGGMVLAAATVLREQGFDPARHMLVWAVDVGHLAFQMCYIQLALAGIAAYVERADTLRLEHFTGAWTPAALIFHSAHGHLDFGHHRQAAGESENANTSVSPEANPPTEPEETPVQLSLF